MRKKKKKILDTNSTFYCKAEFLLFTVGQSSVLVYFSVVLSFAISLASRSPEIAFGWNRLPSFASPFR